MTDDELWDAWAVELARPMAPRPTAPDWAFDDLVAPGRDADRDTAVPVPVPAGSVSATQVAPTNAAPLPREDVGPTDLVLSQPMAQLVDAVAAVQAQAAVDLPGPQALAETAVLLRQVEALRVTTLARLADVETRRLSVLDDAPSVTSWVRRQATSIDAGDVTLARRLARVPQVQRALDSGAVTIGQARKVAAAVGTVRRHVDRPDRLIDGADGEQVVTNVVVDGVRQVVCEAVGGLADDDPRLAVLRDQLACIAAARTSQLDRLEAAFLVVAARVEAPSLTEALGRLVDAVLPQALEQRAEDAHADRGLTLVRKPGGGWRVVDGDLDDECGELLNVLLTAEQAVDPDNPVDTADYEVLREQGWQSGDALPADEPRGSGDGPRSRRQQRHDAFRNGLRRALDSGRLGVRDKVAPHLSVTVGIETLEGEPGALPARAGSGAVLAGSLVRRLACASSVTRFVMGLGRKAFEASHTQRTLTGLERRAKRIETGGVCQGAGCTRGPGALLVPHHPDAYARSRLTSLADSILFCELDHHRVHSGQVVLLKDGRRLGPDGWVVDRRAA